MESAMLKVDGDPAAIKRWAAKGYPSKVAREEFDHIHRLDALRQAGESLTVELYSDRSLPRRTPQVPLSGTKTDTSAK
ncbi:hypothetical protein DIPPA_31848 [Diplonema papillatum]|nr:hypothetical protein DIPPA_31848 [Diplonema papillatum]